jgi:hypothetical protein
MITRIGLLISAPAILLALAASASGDEAPRSDSVNNLSAQVTIPYQEFKRLLDAASLVAKPEDFRRRAQRLRCQWNEKAERWW